jgi:hypothetical protein
MTGRPPCSAPADPETGQIAVQLPVAGLGALDELGDGGNDDVVERPRFVASGPAFEGFLGGDTDDDGHWFLITADGHEAFHSWVHGMAEDAASGLDVPDGVVRLGGHPNNVTFESPLEFGKAIAMDAP